jgi:hypothetical protein
MAKALREQAWNKRWSKAERASFLHMGGWHCPSRNIRLLIGPF